MSETVQAIQVTDATAFLNAISSLEFDVQATFEIENGYELHIWFPTMEIAVQAYELGDAFVIKDNV